MADKKKSEKKNTTKKKAEKTPPPFLIAIVKYRGKSTSVNLKEEVVMICEDAFRGTNVKNVRSKGPLTVIGKSSFQDCKSLAGVGMPNATEIGESAFEGCSALKTLNVPQTIESAPNYLKGIKAGKLEFNNQVKTIGSRAFAGCDDVVEVVIPESLEHLGENVFSGKKLARITVNKANPYFESDEDGALYSKDRKILLRYPCAKGGVMIGFPQRATGKYEIPAGVEEIAPFAFEGCVNLKKIIIPDSVKKIGREAFAGCTSLEEVILPESIEIEGAAFMGNSGRLKLMQPKKTQTAASA